ncbi:MAG: hypothetical protein QM652_13385 [Legionella sp.]|uniref:hypothetical protein n=1 Tax=Legionella sp. TaxID=459 RepID=UPI0039E4F138
MYHKKTIFVLGAGASCHYGYPLGNQLIPQMLKSLEDQIPIPVVQGEKNGVFYNSSDKENGRLYHFDSIKKFLLENSVYHEKENHVFHPSRNAIERLQFCDGINPVGGYYDNNFYLIKIGEFDKFNELKNRLEKSNPLSIDVFLRNNPDFGEVAKTLIIYTLLKCENMDHFNLNHKGHPDPWLPILFNELTQGCTSDPSSILDNKVHFITFNYDVSFEYYLDRTFRETQLFSNNTAAIHEFINERIHHVYGSLPTLANLAKYGQYNDANQTRDKITNQYYRFLNSLLNNESILTIDGERRALKHDIIPSLIREAETINIMGFSFDKDNLSILGFPITGEGWQKYHTDLKTLQIINYLNYKGYNGRLRKEFNTISRIITQNKSHFIIPNESTAENISNALSYDFKSFLFEGPCE